MAGKAPVPTDVLRAYVATLAGGLPRVSILRGEERWFRERAIAAAVAAAEKAGLEVVRHDARDPDFDLRTLISDAQADILLEKLARGLALDQPGLRRIAQAIFWMIAGLCDEHRLPFDLMIGVNRQVYPAGVFQGQDLFDSRCSLLPYAALFRAFPRVAFPVSVLSVGLNQELVAYSWIFPNVIAHGHWWYANIPAFILADCRSRLQAVPQTKQIGYYSDMYKLEFALPKFAMYRRILATALAEDFVIGRGWSEERAVALGRTVLRGNVDRLFPPHGK